MIFLDPRKDHFLTKQGSFWPFYDKLEHFLLAAALYVFLHCLLALIFPVFDSVLFSQMCIRLLGIAWEIKDGIKPYNQYGDIQGFSFSDLIANELGMRIAADVVFLLTPIHSISI